MSFSLYGLLLGLGFVVFWTLFETVLKTAHPTAAQARSPYSGSLTTALLLISGGALVGARIYHLWTDWELYASLPWVTWVEVWNGGLGIYGALLGGLAGLAVWKRWWGTTDLSWLFLLDAAAFGVPLGQAIGRWGNYANKELFGLPSNLPWAIAIPAHLRPIEYLTATTFHPLFLYESIGLLFVGGFFLLLWRKYATIFPFGTGWYCGSYLFAYGSIRFCLELLRVESAAGWLGLSIAQWVSLVATVFGLVLFSRAFRLQWNNESSFAPLATADSAPPRRPRSAQRPRPHPRSHSSARSSAKPKPRK